jgi:anti-sigma regulatory factor (Ser/Thr protein kinase)
MLTTSRPSRQNPAVREFILRNVSRYPDSVAALAGEKFGLSRTSIARYMQRLIGEGLLEAEGKTYARRYKLRKIVDVQFPLEIDANSSEDTIWHFKIVPQIKNLPANIVDICQYGFTEMLNNVIDHSGSNTAMACYEQTYSEAYMMVIDYGVGIFDKIQKDFDLIDPRGALLELAKGKLTSDKTRHSGEGIYYTSRMFDGFSIRSGYLYYSREMVGTEWLIETEDKPSYKIGTAVHMRISTEANWTMREVFDKYQNDEIGFRKTHVPVKLGKYPGEQLVSRSQAKRVLARFDKFSEVLLDFQGVEEIGQAFADEIFRVFKNSHPDIEIIAINTSPEIQQMIAHVRAAERRARESGGAI